MALAPPAFIQIGESAYRMAGVLKAAGRGLSPEQQVELQDVANAMFDGLKIERCFVYQVLRTLVSIALDTAEYTVGDAGSGAAWILNEKPDEIFGAAALISSGNPTNPSEIPIEVIRDYVQWKAITNKSTKSGLVRVLYYRNTLEQMLGTVEVWPVPNSVTNPNLALYTPGLVDEISDINAPIFFPKGFRQFVQYQLTCNVHDRYPNAQWDGNRIQRMAREYKARVMAAQLTPTFVGCDEGALHRPASATGRRWYDARTWMP